ncbi:MAG: ATP-binding protein, partial [Elusimicrobiota bacterium]|nr:ATP-binding protein [Elusimicrobiota bacterium]
MKFGKFEKDRIEYKKAAGGVSKTIYKTISAFANTNGGLIILGIKQGKGKIIKQGVGNPQQLIDDIVSTVAQIYNFCPVFKPEIVGENKKFFIKIKVAEASRLEKPIYILEKGAVKGGFKRIGSSDIHLTDMEVQRFYQGRMRAPDAQILDETSIKDIDKSALNAFRNLRKLEKENAGESKLNNKDLLKAYKLLSKDGKNLNIAGLLLFGKEEEI